MAMIDELLVSVAPGETRIAAIAGGRAVEFFIDRDEAAPGDVILGRVITVNAALGSAFVDIGRAKPGFLGAPGTLSEGQAVVVQVTTAARGSKGAAVTATPSLAGRLLAYTPVRPGLNLSRRILDNAARDRLAALFRPQMTEGEGLVVRTAAAEAPGETLLAEFRTLRDRWQAIQAAAARAVPPTPLYAPSPLARVLAEFPAICRLRVDDTAALSEARALFPGAELDVGAFEREVGEDLDLALEPCVPLAGAGAMTIETTAAVTTIDIDSGGKAPLAANLAALPELARQLRLRNVAGHILVDLIPLKDRRALGRLVEALRQAVADDPTPTHVVGTTPLGLVEMTRERRRPSLTEIMLTARLPTPSAETLALAALRAVLRAAHAQPAAKWIIAAAPAVAAALAERPAALAEAARRLGRPPVVRTETSLAGFELIEEAP